MKPLPVPVPTQFRPGKSLSRRSVFLSLALLAPIAANAATIYSEIIGTGTGNGNATFGSINWTVYQNNGTNWTTGPLPPTSPALAYIAESGSLIASSSTVFSTHLALLTDAGSIDPTAYQNDLTISFSESATNAGGDSPAMGWRALAQVGSTVYVSDFIGYSASQTTRNLTVSDSIWHVWTGEASLTDGFNIANISGTAGALAAGTISGLGILAIDGADNNDRMRIHNYSITGTAIPEPQAALLGGIGLLALLRRRR